jgi:hypothetical protein
MHAGDSAGKAGNGVEESVNGVNRESMGGGSANKRIKQPHNSRGAIQSKELANIRTASNSPGDGGQKRFSKAEPKTAVSLQKRSNFQSQD